MPNPDRPNYTKLRRGRDPLQPQVFRTQRPDKPEDLWQPLYDRVNFLAAGSSELGFFSQPLGSNVTLITAGAAAPKSKTLRDTNMQNSNVVPTKLFRFEGISVDIIHLNNNVSTNALDRQIVRDGGYLIFKIVDKEILNIPLLAIPDMNGIQAVSTTANNTTINAYGGGRSGMYRFPIPIVLNPYESFQVALKFDGSPAVTNTLDILVMLQGYMRRPT